MPGFTRLIRTVLLGCVSTIQGFSAEPELAPGDLPRFPAVEPSATLETFVVRPEFRLELAAHEPQVVDPIALSFDERGRAYVIEMRDYSERRPERLGRVRLLEDRDGDGVMETSTVFLDNLPWPTAVTCWDGGVFIGATPDLLYAKDTDVDGKADIREVVFTGFASDAAPYATNRLNVQALLNSLQWGLDCRIHGATSLSGGRVQRVDSPFTRAWRQRGSGTPNASEANPMTVDLRGRDFSFDPWTLELRTETGGGQHGMSFDDTGRKFLCSNSDHLQIVRLEDRHATRGAWENSPVRASIAIDGPAAPVFRISPEEPWRIVRTRWRVTGLVSGPIEGGGRASGYFTGATGVTIYRGDAYPAEFRGNAFVADCGSNLIHRKLLREEGCEVVGERPADEQGREFIASRDTWFRPVQFANAPDGCLWILDMYREIIEHPWSLPPNLKRHLDLNSGNDRGRIYRIAPRSGVPRRQVDLARTSTVELVGLLDHANGWHRDTASRLLVERRDPAAIPLLRRLLQGSGSATGKLHALYVLETLGGCEVPDLLDATADSSPAVRRHAVRLAELRFADKELPSGLARRWSEMRDPDPLVRLQLACAMGTVRHPDRRDLMAELIRASAGKPGEHLVQEAIVAFAGDDVMPLIHKLGSPGDSAASVREALVSLAGLVGRRARGDEVADLLSQVARNREGLPALRMAAALAEGLRRAGRSLETIAAEGQWRPIHELAASILTNRTSATASLRTDALTFLGHVPAGLARPPLLAALENARTHGRDEQGRVIQSLIRAEGEAAWPLLLPYWPSLASDARQRALEQILRLPGGPAGVLEAMAAKRVPAADLSTAQVAMLRNHPDRHVRQRAMDVLGAAPADRNEAVVATLPALDLDGDRGRGRLLYQLHCASCHRLGGEGHALGPDLESVKSQPREKLLLAIIDPNREVAPSYFSTTIETMDDELLTGVLAADNANSVRLRMAFGVESELARDQIRSLRSESRSLMPEGFEATLTLQDLADLLAFLTE